MALDVDAYRPGFTENPYPLLAELREAGPVHQIETFGMPIWLVTRYEDVRAALVDPLLSNHGSNANERTRALPMISEGWLGELRHHMLMNDPPEHSRLRRVVSREFTPRRIAALRPRIEQVTTELLDAIAPAGKADLIEEFAAPLPVTIIMELLGVPEADRARFRIWTEVATGVKEGDLEQLPQVHAEVRAYLRDLVKHKRAQREEIAATDLIGALAVGGGDDRLSDPELVSLSFLLLVAGYTTTIDMIGNGTLALLRDPRQLDLLRREPELVPAAVEEFLRFDGPTMNATLRFAKPGLVIGGVQIPAGDLVQLSLASADHDRAQFERADELDIRRTDRAHLAFGHGIHFCIGAPLARLEGEIAFRSLLERCPDLALAKPTALTWRLSLMVRGLRNLPVTFTPAS